MKNFKGLVAVMGVSVFIFTGVAELFAGPLLPLRKNPGVYHHSMGRAGQGICPQERLTAQAPEDISRLKNPLPPTQKNLDAGESLYHRDVQPTACKICHGDSGNGLGMMTEGLNPPPRNFTCKETMQGISDGQLFWIIKNGSPGTGMPAYRDLSETQVWQMIHFIRQFAER